MSIRTLIALFIALMTTNCAAQPGKDYVAVDEEDIVELPLVVEWNDNKNSGPGYREAVNKALSKQARRVLVIFEESGGKNCPVEVRTIDTVCRTRAYDSVDPSVICRVAGPGITGTRATGQLDTIIWRGEDEDDKFKISFEGPSPCTGDWPSKNFKRKQACQLKSANELGVETGKAAYFKYNILSEDSDNSNPECDLDPHFIVRN